MQVRGGGMFDNPRHVYVAAPLIALTVGLASWGLSACSGIDRSVVATPADAVPRASTSAEAGSTSASDAPTTPAPTVPATTTTAIATTTVAPTTTTTQPAPTTTVEEKVPPAPATIPPMRQGESGLAVFTLQQRLLDLGFWIESVDGQYGFVTSQAVMAFQKMYGGIFDLQATGQVDDVTAAAMMLIEYRAKGTSTEGDLIEVDKSRQLMFLIRGGKTIWTFNASTGTGKPYTEINQKTGAPITDIAITPEGQFKVDREYTDGWEKGQLGELYRPKYFKGGVAVHGSRSIPNYPASHGCVRITTDAMDWIWEADIMPSGSRVLVLG